MFGIFPASCISTIETLLHINLDAPIVLANQHLPHPRSWLSEIVIRRGHKDLHLYVHRKSNVGYFDFDVFRVGLSLFNAKLVGEDNYFEALFGQFFDSGGHFVKEEDPIVCVFGELRSTFSSD